jgi:hypothetical protein
VKINCDEPARWFVMEHGAVSAAGNLANHPGRVPLRIGEHKILLASKPDVNAVDRSVSLPRESVAILKLVLN